VTTEERLRQAAVTGDRLAELVERHAPGSDEEARQAREDWSLLMADCQRAGEIAAPTAPTGFEEHGA
jgi:hypothetical protein